ncbi:hypothetical protein [Rugosimonospora africana]|uniref:Uncharacterized protein n=1 Tax=Rugosimonospora africana TaxID=556532 RepID=A0A8J3QRE3_9ACTN|nr:hypothetical protein [Rugosimonospora africana]GIH15483.1 hypothetical protein Raf01_36550 [Rugosimonospora africana]
MSDTKQSAEGLAILEQLNLLYDHSDQVSDAKRFSEFLAEDFIVQTPGVTRDREEYLHDRRWSGARSSVHGHVPEAWGSLGLRLRMRDRPGRLTRRHV